MIFHSMKAPTLKSEVSPVEFVTALTAGAVTIACIYNWGFFSPIGGSLASLLTIPDLLIGAAVSAVPTALLLGFGLLWPELIPRKRKRKETTDEILHRELAEEGSFERLVDKYEGFLRKAAIGSFVGALLFSAATFAWIVLYPSFLPPIQSLATFASGGLWIMTAIANRNSDAIRLCLLVLTICFVAFVTGRGVYFSAVTSSGDHVSTITLTSGDTLTGGIIRATSSYVFVLADDAVSILPTRDIARMALNAVPDDIFEQIANTGRSGEIGSALKE